MSEYPPDEVLKQIEELPCGDFHSFMSFIYTHWAFSDWGWSQDGDVYHISTAGWSGNEDLIYAMKQNTMFWMLYWQQSRRGGHYIFAPLSVMLNINDAEHRVHWTLRLWAWLKNNLVLGLRH